MKRLVLVITAVLVLVLGIIGCAQTQTPQPKPDIPRYTADQVIAVAQAQYTSVSYTKGRTSARVSVSYQGGGIWKVEISPLIGYVLEGPEGRFTGVRTRYFNEATNSLQ